MHSRWMWPRRLLDMECSGTVPWGLDGLFVLPERAMGRDPTHLHGVRLQRGAAVWYSLLPVELVRRLGTRTTILTGRSEAPRSLAWTLTDHGGRVRETGRFELDRVSEVIDLSFTCATIVALCACPDPADDWNPATPHFRVGIAPRRGGSRLVSHAVGRTGWPSLLRTGDRDDAVVVDVAWSHSPGSRSANISRVTLGRASDGPQQQTYPRAFAYPTPHPAEGCAPSRFLYGLVDPCSPGRSVELVRLDQESGLTRGRTFDFASHPGAPTLVSLTGSRRYRRAVLFAPVYDAVRDVSELLILDPGHLDAPPLARIRLPRPMLNDRPGEWVRARGGLV